MTYEPVSTCDHCGAVYPGFRDADRCCADDAASVGTSIAAEQGAVRTAEREQASGRERVPVPR